MVGPLAHEALSFVGLNNVRNADARIVGRKVAAVARYQKGVARTSRCPDDCVRQLDAMLTAQSNGLFGNEGVELSQFESCQEGTGGGLLSGRDSDEYLD